jgi:predicted PurR-regulated permease PerM
MQTLVAICFSVAIAFFAFAIKLERDFERRQAVLTALAGLAALMIGILALLFAPNFSGNGRNNAGFEPDWSCLNLGRGGAQVCGRDTPAENTKPAKP